MGAVSFTRTVKVGKAVALAETGMKPESKPTCPEVEVEVRERQGALKEDCVTVWFFTMNWKVIVSPTCAVILEGEKTRSKRHDNEFSCKWF